MWGTCANSAESKSIRIAESSVMGNSLYKVTRGQQEIANYNNTGRLDRLISGHEMTRVPSQEDSEVRFTVMQ